ncbi:UNVERIFIED_CONTAM: putative mitochondrial protein [Sesamum latifolium]|uniref:Mitochondrial protein n=1 Tax=Sesamum latifolium TaxID=2727402 RepID=A0AAW2YAV7_9LAMI
MMCVSTVSFSFLLNGEQFGFLRPERGIRQGDPLSPYLFLFCAKVLSHLLQQAEIKGEIQGVAVARHAPQVSHLLFADDTMIFFEATHKAICTVKEILLKFEMASVLKINLEKSAVVFSSNVHITRQEELATILGVGVKRKHDKYLGLPSVVGRAKRDVFEGLKDRCWQKLNGWATKKLSQAGRVTLIKSVLQAIPSYIMNCFEIPKGTLKELERMMANFF